MGKTTARKKHKAKRTVGNIHPLISLAKSNGARLDGGQFEVAQVPNPHGEVIVRGDVRQHKAVRRVPHFETLYRSNVIDRHVFVCLEWYAGRLALAQSGMFKCGLGAANGGGGTAQSHVPTTEAAMQARSDVEWARGFIPGSELRLVFDGVMELEESFAQVGLRTYPKLSSDRAKRKASAAFKIAANHLLLGIGHHLMRMPQAA